MAPGKRIRLPKQEMWVQSPGGEDPLEKDMATHSSIFAWKIPWTEEPGRLQFMGPQRAGHNRAIEQANESRRSGKFHFQHN